MLRLVPACGLPSWVAVPGTAELALLCWLSGAAFVLLVESSPI